MLLALGCERTGSDNASDKRQNCRLSLALSLDPGAFTPIRFQSTYLVRLGLSRTRRVLGRPRLSSSIPALSSYITDSVSSIVTGGYNRIAVFKI